MFDESMAGDSVDIGVRDSAPSSSSGSSLIDFAKALNFLWTFLEVGESLKTMNIYKIDKLVHKIRQQIITQPQTLTCMRKL